MLRDSATLLHVRGAALALMLFVAWVTPSGFAYADSVAEIDQGPRQGTMRDPLPPSVETYQFERMWPQLPQPWYFTYPSDVTADKSRHIYVVDSFNHRIVKFDHSGRFLLKWGVGGSEVGQFQFPSNIAADRLSNNYVTDRYQDNIQKFDSNGRFLIRWGSHGTGDGQLNDVRGVSVDGEGNVYAADRLNDRVQKFDSSGGFLTKWGVYGSREGQFSAPEAVAADDVGNVYVADSGNHRIQKFDPNGTYITEWGGYGAGDGMFKYPQGLSIDTRGDVYVSDSGNHRIQKFGSDGVFIAKWGTSGSGDGQFTNPQGIAAVGLESLYIADVNNHRIQEFGSSGAFVSKWTSVGSSDGQFYSPYGVAVDGSGNVYVADYRNHRIQKFNSNGAFNAQWGGEGTTDGQYQHPQGVAIDTLSNVYVADTDNYRIQKLDSNGVFIANWGSSGSGVGEFGTDGFGNGGPYDLAVDPSGNVYVADPYNERIQKFDSSGAFLIAWGNQGSGDGEFDFPVSIAVDVSGNVYVGDFRNGRVQKFNSYGIFITKWGCQPNNLAVDMLGNVYVSDSNYHKIEKYNASGMFLNGWGSFGSGPGGFNHPSGLAIDGLGNVFVADGNNRIQKFRPVTLFSYDKAVVVAGRKSADDILWPATQKVTIDAIKALNFRGISKEQTHYLSHNTDLDLDDNLLPDDVAGLPTVSNLQDALTAWATTSLNGLPIENVVVYLADHGGPDHYYLSEDVTLDAATLNGWLNTLEAGITGQLTVVLEACYSGSFLDTLRKPGRIVITSTLPTEEAYFLDNGVASFSGFFWQQVLFGRDLKTAFTAAESAVDTGGLPQHPQVDVDGDGVANEPVDDLDALANVHIGSDIQIATAFPTITSVAITGLSGSTATLQANGVTDADGNVARVFAKIQPPGFGTTDWEGNPILGLPEVTLELDSGDDYAISYNGFTKQGTYNVTFYAMDNFLYLGEPKSTTVTVGSPLHRRAVIVAGGSLAHQQWPAYQRSYARAFEALKKQLYDDSDIMVMAHANVLPTTEGVTIPTIQGLTGIGAGTVRGWVGSNTQDLTIYLVGPGADEFFQLNDSEYLTSSAFSTLLDTLQASLTPGGTLTVVMDACSAGSFADNLAGADRMIVMGTREGESATFVEEGTGIVSFSEFFWTRTGKGDTVELAYLRARDSMAAHDQVPGLDDNGDGLLSQVSDGSKARYYRIGHGVILGADEPVVREAIQYEELSGGTTSATLWANGVFSPGRSVTSVWASIAPPGYGDSGGACQALLTRIPLGSGVGHDYEALYDRFTQEGDYQIKIYCTDNRGNTSAAKSAIVRQMETNLGDTVKPDVTDFNPVNAATGVASYPVIRFTVNDTGSGVDINGITLTVNGINVSKSLQILGTPGSYAVRYSPPTGFLPGAKVYVSVTAADLDGNVRGPLNYRFTVSNGIDGNGDGMPDDWAVFYGLSSAGGNPDGDQYTNAEEAELGTDPRFFDSLPTGPDSFEDDDTYADARWVDLNGADQVHTFHDRGDVDWVLFYATTGMVLNLRTLGLGPDADTTIEVYADGSFGEGEAIATDTNPGDLAAVILSWAVPSNGYYYVKIRNSGQKQYLYGANAYYVFKVQWPTGGPNITAKISNAVRPGQVGKNVALNGSFSSDGGKVPVSWAWSFVRYPAALPSLTVVNNSLAYFTPAEEGLYVVKLRLLDDQGLYSEARAYITVGETSAQVWVDFDPPSGYPEADARGTADKPFREIWRAEDKISPAGTISIATGDTAETPTLGETGKTFQMLAVGGTVRIGVVVSKQAFAPQVAAAPSASPFVDAAELFAQLAGKIAPAEDSGNRIWYDQTTYEPVIPFTRTVEGMQAAQAESPLAIRLRSDAAIDPDSIWGPIPGYTQEEATAQWQPVTEGDMRDIWVVCKPAEAWYLEDVIGITAGAETVTGQAVDSEVFTFKVETEDTYAERKTMPLETEPQPVSSDEAPSDAVVTGTEDGAIALPVGVSDPYTIGPEQVYDTPQRVWLKLPQGIAPDQAQVYYYKAHGDDRGWYPAENVEGWLVPASYLNLRQGGETYLGFLVRHAGIVQLGIAKS